MILKTACQENNTCFFAKRSFTHMWTSNRFNRCGDCFMGWTFCCNWYMNFSWSMMWRNYWWFCEQMLFRIWMFFLFFMENQHHIYVLIHGIGKDQIHDVILVFLNGLLVGSWIKINTGDFFVILKNNSCSNTKCWKGEYVISWSWWSLLLNKIGCFGYTEKCQVFSGTNCKLWSKRKYDSIHWNNNIWKFFIMSLSTLLCFLSLLYLHIAGMV